MSVVSVFWNTLPNGVKEIACDFSLAKPKIRKKPWHVVWQSFVIPLHQSNPADYTTQWLAQTSLSIGAWGKEMPLSK